MVPAGEKVILPKRRQSTIPQAERFVICSGLLTGKPLAEQTPEELFLAWEANFVRPAIECEFILANNPKARIVLMGSDSAFSGSYDEAYAGAKAALSRYVETKKLQPDQQLVCIAPSIIADAGMTTRRSDTERLGERMNRHPKRRFLMAAEVARLIYFLLYVDAGYLSGVTIRLNGGEHAWR